MHIWRKQGWRTLFSVAFLITLVLGSGMSVPAANATTNVWLSDNFENNPASRWWSEHVAEKGGVTFPNGAGTARSPTTNALIYAQNGWTAAGRMVKLPLTAPYYQWSCTASIWFRTIGLPDPLPKLNLEVIDPSTWKYIGLRTMSVPFNFADWYNISLSFVPTRKDMVVRLAVVQAAATTGAVHADDFAMHCYPTL